MGTMRWNLHSVQVFRKARTECGLHLLGARERPLWSENMPGAASTHKKTRKYKERLCRLRNVGGALCPDFTGSDPASRGIKPLPHPNHRTFFGGPGGSE